jgi:hypothetical protein
VVHELTQLERVILFGIESRDVVLAQVGPIRLGSASEGSDATDRRRDTVEWSL